MTEAFTYCGGELYAERVAIRRIVAEIGTPAYIYSAAALAAGYRRFAKAFSGQPARICYAVKANSNLAVLRLFAKLGSGADVVSEGELRRALAAGIPPERIVFSGVGKTTREMAAALAAGIDQINVESVAELQVLSAVAAKRGQRAVVALRINPDVDAPTHAKIATGNKDHKFGIDFEQAADAYHYATSLPGIVPVGLALHIGSQLVDLDPFRRAFERLAALVRALRGTGRTVDRIDLGGGLAIRYREERPPPAADYARLVERVFDGLNLAVTIEPGRALAGAAGVLIARVLYVKEAAARRFVILDAAMNDLIRPALYDAWHDILPVRQPSPDVWSALSDVVGPVCESSDTFAVDRDLPPLAAGDLVAFTAAGAYGAVMSSTYNSRLLVPETLVSGDRYAVIRARPDYDAFLSLDTIPDWLEDFSAKSGRERGVV